MVDYVKKLEKDLKLLYDERKDRATMPFEKFREKAFKRFLADAQEPDLFYDIMED